ncbi:hypothetical protein D3C76_1458650 [compost metagenome]
MVKISYLNTRNSSRGCFIAVSLRTKNVMNRIPMIKVNSTIALLHPLSPAELNPYSRNPNPIVEKSAPYASNLGELSLDTFRSQRKANRISSKASGITM